MKSFKISVTILSLAIFAAGCSDNGNGTPDASVQKDTGPRAFGGVCSANEDCTSKLCVGGFCSKTCRSQVGCPPMRVDPDPKKPAGTLGGPCTKEGYCGAGGRCLAGECVRAFDCGRVDEKTVACYPARYDTRKYATGHDCSLDGVCGQTYKCIGPPGAAGRICSPTCNDDKDCPPALRCANVTTYGGKPEKRCRTRQFGHPCELDDQCGGPARKDLVCLKGTTGDKYCTKTCTKTEQGTCPPFAKCEDGGGGVTLCKFKAGYAYKNKGGRCAPCIHHGDADGKALLEVDGCVTGGLCFQLSPYTREAACLAPCLTMLGLSPTALTFTVEEGAANPAAKEITIRNLGAGTLTAATHNTRFARGSGWLTVSAQGKDNDQKLKLSVDGSGLKPMTYAANVTVTVKDVLGSPQSFTVWLVVTPKPTPTPDGGVTTPDAGPDAQAQPTKPPTLDLTPAALTFAAQKGQKTTVKSQDVAVANSGDTTKILGAAKTTITYVNGSGWLTTVVSGSGNKQTLTNKVDISGLASDTYSAIVTVQASGASNGAQSYRVVLRVSQSDADERCPADPNDKCFTFSATNAKLCAPTRVVQGRTTVGSCHQ